NSRTREIRRASRTGRAVSWPDDPNQTPERVSVHSPVEPNPWRDQHVPYNRTAAVAYARRYWNVVTHDNCIATDSNPCLRVEPGTRFIHSGSEEFALRPTGRRVPWSQLEDCTHFISCCIGSPG